MKLQSNRLPPVTTPNVGGTLRVPAPHTECAGYIVCGRRTARRGFTLLEFVVALLLFGIAMSGLFPMVVMYSRMLESLEQRPNQLALDRLAYRVEHPLEWYQVPADPPVPNSGEWVHKWYLVPFSDIPSSTSSAWARKLGASASVKIGTYTTYTQQTPTAPTKCDNSLDADDIESDSSYVEAVPANWTTGSSAAAYYDSYRKQQVAEETTAEWTFTVSEKGWYQVQATGFVPGTSTSDSSYTVTYGTGPTSDPVSLPSDKMFEFGTSLEWTVLTTKYFSADTVTVQLTTGTSGTAIADGMQLVRCSVQVESWTPPTTETAEATATVEIKPAVREP